MNNSALSINTGVANYNFNIAQPAQGTPNLEPLVRTRGRSNVVRQTRSPVIRGRANISRSPSPVPGAKPTGFTSSAQSFVPVVPTSAARGSLTHIKGLNRSMGSRTLTRRTRRVTRRNRNRR